MMDIASWLVPLLLTGLVGAVAWIVRLAMIITVLQKDNDRQERDLADIKADAKAHVEWDRAQHKELFDSRNDSRETSARILSTLESVERNTTEILSRSTK